MDNGTFIFQLVTVIGLLIPIGTLIWKAAKQSGRIETLTERINKLEETYKTDVHEIKTDISSINSEIASMRTALDFIKDAIRKNV